MKLSQPKAYEEIKPLRNSAGQPIHCTPSHQARAVIPEIENRVDCTACLAKACRTAKCDQ